MKTEDDKEQTPGQSPPPSRLLKIFLGINLAALAGVFIWELGISALRGGDIEKSEGSKKDVLLERLAENPAPGDLSGKLSSRIRYTIDATEPGRWAHFSFSRMDVFYRDEIARDSLDWDMAFRRAKIVTNGGATNPEGGVAVAEAPALELDGVAEAPPDTEFREDAATDNPLEPDNPALDKWYKYDFWKHRLEPKKRVYVIKTSSGHYAKMRILGYYCGGTAACYSIEYVYQGAGGRSFELPQRGKNVSTHGNNVSRRGAHDGAAPRQPSVPPTDSFARPG